MSFAADVSKGLSSPFKTLPSRYFYDKTGDKIFQEIMAMPEYYLTDCEYEIFSGQTSDILQSLEFSKAEFDLVEFGAGDGYKTKVLIGQMLSEGAKFRYVPIDISGEVLQVLQKDIEGLHPDLEVHPINAEYFSALNDLSANSDRPKLIMFIGSNIGNFNEERTHEFLRGLYDKLNTGDQVLLGYDLRKNPHVIRNAYDDAAGITKRFNLNLLERINRELQGEFDLRQWDHYATYNPETGMAQSYLVSLAAQKVRIRALDATFRFQQGECIHTEFSRKYTLVQMENFLENSGFSLKQHFKDSRGYYANTLVEKLN